MRSLTRNACASIAQVLASTAILFFLYRVILDEIGAELLGVWSIVLATTSASRIAELGISNSVTRFVAKYRARADSRAVNDVVQTATLSVSALLILVLFIAFPLLLQAFDHIFEGDALAQAQSILPLALISLMASGISAVSQSGLDGYQRHDLRAVLAITVQLAYFGAAVWLLPSYGLMGLALAQVGQGVLAACGGWVLLRRILPGLPAIPWHWKLETFREILAYGLQFQLGSIAMMLFEPLTKALLGRFGGLSATAYFEMAHQFVSKARQLIVAANAVVVPVAAGLAETNPRALHDVYRSNVCMLFVTILPIYTLVYSWAPTLSELWIGQYQAQFVYFTYALAFAWSLNTYASSAYFLQLGSGRILWNTASHVWIGLINGVIGLTLGPWFGTDAILWGMVFALVSGSILVTIGFHRVHKVSLRFLLPDHSLGLVISSAIVLASFTYLYGSLTTTTTIIRYTVCFMFPIIVLFPAIWTNRHSRSLRKHATSLLVSGRA